MNDELCSGGNLSEKTAAIRRGTRSGLLIHKSMELFPKKVRLTENEILEKKLADAQEYVEKERERRKSELPFAGSPIIEKSADAAVVGPISKDVVEKIMKDGGWDKLPMTDRAREIVEDAITRGAKPATEYTGKLLVEHAIPEEPPAFTRPKNIKVGDTVVPLRWTDVCTQGAKFDLPNVPEAAKVKKMYTGPAKVTKESFPYGKFPSDLSKVETVMEDRLWALELEPIGIKKDGEESYVLPVTTRDTTLVLRLDPQATPSGEVNPGVSQRD
jgi:ribosomal protein L22